MAIAGITVIEKTALPMLLAKPNSVILTPCLRKLSMVVVSSGTEFPSATTIPVTSLLNLYHLDILKSDGIRKCSAIKARLISKYIAKMTSKKKNTLLVWSLLNSYSRFYADERTVSLMY